jgi:hypothetical protein
MVALKKSLSNLKSRIGKKIPAGFKKWLKTPQGKAIMTTGVTLATALIIWRVRGRYHTRHERQQVAKDATKFIDEKLPDVLDTTSKKISKDIDEKLPDILDTTSKKISEDIATNVSANVPFKTVGLKEAEYKQTLTKIKMSEKDQKLKEKIIKKNVLLKEDKKIKKKEAEIQKLMNSTTSYKNQQKLKKLKFEKGNLESKHQATKDFLKDMAAMAARKRTRRKRKTKKRRLSSRKKKKN